MAECNSTLPPPAPQTATRPCVVVALPAPARMESMLTLSKDVQQRAVRLQLIEALRDAEDALSAQLGDHHPTLQKVRAALAAASLLSSAS